MIAFRDIFSTGQNVHLLGATLAKLRSRPQMRAQPLTGSGRRAGG